MKSRNDAQEMTPKHRTHAAHSAQSTSTHAHDNIYSGTHYIHNPGVVDGGACREGVPTLRANLFHSTLGQTGGEVPIPGAAAMVTQWEHHCQIYNIGGERERESERNQATVGGAAGQPRSASSDLRRPKTPNAEDDKNRPRNMYRGLRKPETVIERRLKRSMKRRKARREKRRSSSRPTRAQEPGGKERRMHVTKENCRIVPIIEYGRQLRAGTLNIRGLKKAGKRELVETWMKENQIDILMLQETHIAQNSREDRKEYIWYFSGSEQAAKQSTYAGVGIVIRTDLRNYVYDIEPISDRLMWITLGYVTPITFMNVYFYTAAHSTAEKEGLVTEITQEYKKKCRKGPTYLAGDFNARVQTRMGDHEQCIGQHTFDKRKITLETQDEGVKENRRMFISMCMQLKCKVMNTMFEKPDIKLITHKHQRTRFGPPWVRGDYETLDYVIAGERWKNTVENVESDVFANIDSDHSPLIYTIRVKLKGVHRMRDTRVKYEKCSPEKKMR